MNSGFVSKCVRAHDSFIRSNLRAGNFREHATSWKQMLQFDVGGYAKTFFAHCKSDGNFFERGVSRALADSVDGALDLAHTSANCRERIRHSEAEVVMAMRTQRYSLRITQRLANAKKHFAIFFGHSVTHRAWPIQNCRS